jgi:hypothetical protein
LGDFGGLKEVWEWYDHVVFFVTKECSATTCLYHLFIFIRKSVKKGNGLDNYPGNEMIHISALSFRWVFEKLPISPGSFRAFWKRSNQDLVGSEVLK